MDLEFNKKRQKMPHSFIHIHNSLTFSFFSHLNYRRNERVQLANGWANALGFFHFCNRIGSAFNFGCMIKTSIVVWFTFTYLEFHFEMKWTRENRVNKNTLWNNLCFDLIMRDIHWIAMWSGFGLKLLEFMIVLTAQPIIREFTISFWGTDWITLLHSSSLSNDSWYPHEHIIHFIERKFEVYEYENVLMMQEQGQAIHCLFWIFWSWSREEMI